MLAWEGSVFNNTPTVPDLKRAWTEKKYAMCVYLAGLKVGMDAAYKSVRLAWDDFGKFPQEYGRNNQEIIYIFNFIQDNSWWLHKDKIPKHTRVASEFWNKGEILEGLYLAGIRRGWILVREFYFTAFTALKKLVQDKGFPQ